MWTKTLQMWPLTDETSYSKNSKNGNLTYTTMYRLQKLIIAVIAIVQVSITFIKD